MLWEFRIGKLRNTLENERTLNLVSRLILVAGMKCVRLIQTADTVKPNFTHTYVPMIF